jgi:hypothetical protein
MAECFSCRNAPATVTVTITRVAGEPTTMGLCGECEQVHTLHIPQGDVVSINVQPIEGTQR